MTAPAAAELAVDVPPCGACECCGDQNMTDTAACAMGCSATVASLMGGNAQRRPVSTLSYDHGVIHFSGHSPAPDPSPPKLPILV